MRCDKADDMFACLKNVVMKEKYPVAIYKNQRDDVEMLRVEDHHITRHIHRRDLRG